MKMNRSNLMEYEPLGTGTTGDILGTFPQGKGVGEWGNIGELLGNFPQGKGVGEWGKRPYIEGRSPFPYPQTRIPLCWGH